MENYLITLLLQTNYSFKNLPQIGDKVSYFGQFTHNRGRTGKVDDKKCYGKEFVFVNFESGERCACHFNELMKIEL